MISIKGLEWRFREIDEGLSAILSRKLNIPRLLSDILTARGIIDPEEAYDFLHPNLRFLHDPFLMKDMDKAVRRIGDAVSDGEVILVHGDYDADGITSTAMMMKILASSGYKPPAQWYLPSRYEDGYGLSKNGLKRANELGASLVITVDCGIKALDSVDLAGRMDMDVVVTDHHQPGSEIPDACAVVNPKRSDCHYPFKELAGAGVAFKTGIALNHGEVISGDMRDLLDLVALGTVADLVPLTGENRILTVEGLKQLSITANIGLRALMRESGIDPYPGISSSDLGYKLGPRINAAGRLGSPDMALEMLLTEDRVDADLYARELNNLNFKRKTVGKKLEEEVMEVVFRMNLEEDPFIVVAGEGWHPGVLGIVASSVMVTTGKPSAVITIDGESAKGSCRAPRGFNLIPALESGAHLFEEFGGHELAAGITLKTENITELRRTLIEYTLREHPSNVFNPIQDIDVEVEISQLDLEQLRMLKKMAPNGKGNPLPVVCLREVSLDSGVQVIGEGKHLKFNLNDGGSSLNCIWFGMGQLGESLTRGTLVDVIGIPDIHCWGGVETTQLRIIDMVFL